MLKYLNIINLAVIDHVDLELHAGLNVLTGETGAGKSIIVDALMLLLGRRGGAEMIRSGERVALIEGCFELSEAQEASVRVILSEAGIEPEPGGELLLRRELQAGGRTRVFVNDRVVTAATLKSLQPLLVSIIGQGEQQVLASPSGHLESLDQFAECEALRRQTAEVYLLVKEKSEALRALRRSQSERERLGEFLRYQLKEIEKVSPRVGEDEELKAERELLLHAERALALSAGGYAELYESDESVLARLAVVRRRVQELLAIDRRIEGWLELIETADASLREVAERLRDFGSGTDFSHERLAEIEQRLLAIEGLKRKYGCEIGELERLRAEFIEQLENLETSGERAQQLASELESAKRGYVELAARLSAQRRAAAPQLERRVMAELRQLALEKAQFSVSLETAERAPEPDAGADSCASAEETSANAYWSINGADRVQFLLSANVGESPRPLNRVASGGELSRLMLALRTVCREASARAVTGGVTLVFDEIDVGIGGKTAEAVGRRLASLACLQQVLCVTHQAQIARFALHHYAVSKAVESGRTVTSVRELEGEARVGELARMIGGAEDVSTARETARWMLERVEARPPESGAQATVGRRQRLRASQSRTLKTH